jgi:hypothetical protein
MHSRREILKVNFEEYQRVSKKERKELLDRFVLVTGLNRSYLATACGKLLVPMIWGGYTRCGTQPPPPLHL